jgi:hypothetical protein
MAKSNARKLAPVAPDAQADELRRQIAEAAYYRAEQRGFEPGGEEQDWLQAEAELKAQLGPRAQR